MSQFDVAIIGGGPAGLTASVYTSRANLKTVFIEKGAPGGKMVKTHKIENWSGDISVTGPDLSMRMFSHATSFGSTYKYGDVKDIQTNGEFDHTIVLTSGEEIKAKAVIIATGMNERVPEDVKGIHEYENRGVSYCAICDGALYKGQPSIVIGGGNSAIEEAAYLASVASKVTVIVRNKTRAEQKLIDELLAKCNTEILLGVKPLEIKGEGKVESLLVDDNGTIREIPCASIFPYIGQIPATDFAKNVGILNEVGFIKTDEYMETKVKGIYAIGDVREKEIRQIATAVADGAIAGKIIANRVK